jgi:hypothetical protein
MDYQKIVAALESGIHNSDFCSKKTTVFRIKRAFFFNLSLKQKQQSFSPFLC